MQIFTYVVMKMQEKIKKKFGRNFEKQYLLFYLSDFLLNKKPTI